MPDAELNKKFIVSDKFPAVIRSEYEKCRSELENCSYYGAVFALKDNFECILKSYILCAAVKLQRNKGAETILKLLCNPEKQPSMGVWLADILPVCMEELEGEASWIASFEIIKKYYGKWNIVKWRNDNTGHGALRLSGDQEFIDELQEKFGQLQQLLQKLEAYADQVEWCMEKLEEPYFIRQDDSLWFFEGANHGKGVWLCYENGKRCVREHEKVAGVLKRYYADLNVSDTQGIRDVVYPAYVDAALDAYYKEDDYCKAVYMRDWLQNCMEQHGKGIFLMSADRGTGKSAFSYAMDELGGNKMKLSGTACRAYFCNRSALRTCEDFVMQISRIFYQTADGQEWRSRLENELKGISFGQLERQKAMCVCLDACLRFQKRQGKEKVLLIIDGVDELTPENYPILDFLPRAVDLPEQVYILLTVRADNGAENRIHAWLGQIPFSEKIRFDRKKENAVLLRNAVIKACPEQLAEEQIEKVMDILDYRFSGLKVWRAMASLGMGKVFCENAAKDTISYYMDLLRKCYGSYSYRLDNMFCALAEEEVPLDMCTLAVLSGEKEFQTGTMAIFYDLKPVYIPEHDISGGLYLWKYSDEMRELAEKDKMLLQRLAMLWREELEELTEVAPWQKEGYLYMATHIYGLWERAYGSTEKLPEEFLMKNLHLMAQLNFNNEHYTEAIWHLNALEQTAGIEEQRDIANWKIYFIALVEMIRPLVELKQLSRAGQVIEKAGAVLDQYADEVKQAGDILSMIWQYYGDTMILYAELGDFYRAEKQYQAAMQLPDIPMLSRAVRMNHINMIKQSDPARCLAESEKMIQEMHESAMEDKAGLYYGMAAACDQLAKRNGDGKYVEQEHECLQNGITILEKVPIAPMYFKYNRIYALCLEGMGRWYGVWKNDLTQALRYMEEAAEILRFHNGIQNLIPPEDAMRVNLFRAKWYLERDMENDREKAKKLVQEIESCFRNLSVELSPMHRAAIQSDLAELKSSLL